MIRLLIASAALFGSFSAVGGEIMILQPTPTAATRTEREAERNIDRAREQAGRAAVHQVPYVLEPVGSSGPVPTLPRDQAERLAREAKEHLDPSSVPVVVTEGGVPLLLRAMPPPTEVERARQKARAYIAEPAKPSARNCGAAANQVGMIGEGAGAQKSENVIEKGGSAVNPNCR